MSKPTDSINTLGNAIEETTRGPKAIGLFIADCGAALNLPFLKKDIGERMLSPFFVLVMSVVAIAMCHVMKVDPTIMVVYLGLLWGMTGYHLFSIYRRNKEDKPIHSRCPGDFVIAPLVKRLPKGTDYWWIDGFYEPLIVLLFGLLIRGLIDEGLGSILIICAPWLFLRSQYSRMLHRSKMLDEMDAYLESQYKLDAFNGKPASETAGVIVKNVNNMRPREKEALAKRMLDEKDFASLYNTSNSNS
ncbi:hypothetical protein NBRC116494_17670 [Aurantivibrio plasticivorans]